MKKIFTLAIIALASVAMVACCGQAEKKSCPAEQPAAVEATCDKNCAECEKAKDCPNATPAAETPAPEAPAPAPAK